MRCHAASSRSKWSFHGVEQRAGSSMSEVFPGTCARSEPCLLQPQAGGDVEPKTYARAKSFIHAAHLSVAPLQHYSSNHCELLLLTSALHSAYVTNSTLSICLPPSGCSLVAKDGTPTHSTQFAPNRNCIVPSLHATSAFDTVKLAALLSTAFNTA
jgi:hypothetical protein